MSTKNYKMLLEMYHTGAASAEQQKQAAVLLKTSHEAAEYLQKLQTNRSAYLQRFPFAEQNISALSAQRPARSAPRRQLSTKIIGAIATACFTLTALVGYLWYTAEQTPGMRIKGEPALHYGVKRGDRVFAAHQNYRAEVGDTLQFLYANITRPYAVLISIDDSLHVSQYTPLLRHGYGEKLKLEGQNPLPFSVVIEETNGDELFILLTSDTPLSADELTAVQRQILRPESQSVQQIAQRLSTIKTIDNVRITHIVVPTKE